MYNAFINETISYECERLSVRPNKTNSDWLKLELFFASAWTKWLKIVLEKHDTHDRRIMFKVVHNEATQSK